MKSLILIIASLGIFATLSSIIFGIWTLILCTKLSTWKKRVHPESAGALDDAGWNSFKAYEYINNSEDFDHAEIRAYKISTRKMLKLCLLSIIISFASFGGTGFIILCMRNIGLTP